VVAVPIVEGTSKPMGILFAVMDATWLSDITDMIGYGKKRYSYVIKRTGRCYCAPKSGLRAPAEELYRGS
jgi:hypothetical protein